MVTHTHTHTHVFQNQCAVKLLHEISPTLRVGTCGVVIAAFLFTERNVLDNGGRINFRELYAHTSVVTNWSAVSFVKRNSRLRDSSRIQWFTETGSMKWTRSTSIQSTHTKKNLPKTNNLDLGSQNNVHVIIWRECCTSTLCHMLFVHRTTHSEATGRKKSVLDLVRQREGG